MQKTKYNNRFSTDANRTELHRSFIQTYLGDELDALLSPSADRLSQVGFDELYVQNEIIEEILKQYMHHTHSNGICVVEGHAGSGKTMLIRRALKISNWKACIMDKTLILPFNFESILYEDAKNYFMSIVHAACDCLSKEFPSLNDIDKHPDEFHAYLAEYRQDLLYSCMDYPLPSKLKQLQNLHANNPLMFYSCALKFYLCQTNSCQINNIVLVIDNVEGIRHDGEEIPELRPIKMTLELMEVLQDTRQQIVSWSVNTIICCRRYVSRLLRSSPHSHWQPA